MRWFLVFLLLAGSAAAQPAVQTAPQKPLLGSQFGLTVASATKLTYPAGTVTAICTVEGQSVRYADDGTTPTTTVGTLVPIGGIVTIRLALMSSASNVQFIQTSATATLDCMYYGTP